MRTALFFNPKEPTCKRGELEALVAVGEAMIAHERVSQCYGLLGQSLVRISPKGVGWWPTKRRLE